MLWGGLSATFEKEDISKNQTETFGKVYSSSSIYKKYSKRNYRYEFYYKEKRYTGSSTAYYSANVLEGNFYKVLFSNKNPNNSNMNFEIQYTQQIKVASNKVMDTIYIPTSELKLQLPKAYDKRIEKLRETINIEK